MTQAWTQCPNCGTPAPPGARFCPHCGVGAGARGGSPGPAKIILAVLLALLAAGLGVSALGIGLLGGCFVLLSTFDSSSSGAAAQGFGVGAVALVLGLLAVGAVAAMFRILR